MYQKVDGPRADYMSRLYDEFAQFYAAERCRWAPENPNRVFRLVVEKVYPEYRARVTEEQLLAAMYTTLGFRGADPPGLFQTFDPAKYRKKRLMADHFISFFVRKLRGNLSRIRRRTSDSGRVGDPTRFCPNPDLGLLTERIAPESRRAPVDALPDVLTCLDARERGVIHLTYWADLSQRKVGDLLGMDHKTVGRVHDAAVQKLRRRYGVEENLAA